jgi:type I restriction enzyme S subunit
VSRHIAERVRCAIIPRELDDANCANMIIIRPGKLVSSLYLARLLQRPESQRNLLGRQVGSAQVVVNTRIFQEWRIPVPSMQRQELYAAKMRRLRTLLEQHQDSLQQLDSLLVVLQRRAFCSKTADSLVA